MLRLLTLGLVLLLVACGGAGAPQYIEGVAAPGGVPLTAEHTLSPGDEFDIRLPFAADYNDHVTVGMDGNVAPKQIGSVRVGGLTVPEATGRLKERYAKLLRAPDLAITMRRFAPEVVYVDGWVAKPGLIRSDIALTLERAITRAGGVKIGAKKSAILIMRREENGGLRTYEAAAGGYFGGPNLGEDPLLKSFDVVYVPQTPIAGIVDFAQQYYVNVPFSASFNVAPAAAARVIAPPALAPAAPAPVTPR